MGMVVVGMMRTMEEARELVNELEDAGFDQEDISAKGYVGGLTELGVPESEAHAFAEGVRRGGAVVCVATEDQIQADQAAVIMTRHGAVNVEECATGWKSQGWDGRVPEQAGQAGRYAYVFGEYPVGGGRIYEDPRHTRPYGGPERRRNNEPYGGDDRRTD